MEIRAVEMHQGRRPRPKQRVEPIREVAALVLVVRVGAAAEDTAQVIPEPAERRMLVGNRRRLGNEGGDGLERSAGRISGGAIGLVARAGERHEIDVVRDV